LNYIKNKGKKSFGFSAVVLAILFIGTAASFWTLWPGGFLSDDFDLFAYNTFSFNDVIDRFLPLKGSSFFRPIGFLYFWVIKTIFGPSPEAFLICSLLTHVANSFILVLVTEKLTGNKPVSALAGLLFTVFPLHGESIGWVSCAFDRLCLLFMLSSFYFYIKYRQEGRRYAYIASFFLFAFGLMSKEPAIMLPIILVAFEAIGLNGLKTSGLAPATRRVLPFFALLLAYLGLRVLLFGDIGGYRHADGTPAGLPPEWVFFAHFNNAFELLLLPLNKPWHLDTGVLVNFFSILYLASLTLFILFARGNWKAILFGFSWFFISLLPTLNLTPVQYNLMCTRFLYIPLAGFCIVLSIILYPNYRNKIRLAQTASLACVLLMFVWLSHVNYKPWNIAYKVTASVPAQIKTLVPNPPPNAAMAIIGDLDNLNGAYIFRVGINSAVNNLYSPPKENLEVWNFDSYDKIRGSIDPGRKLYLFEYSKEDFTVRSIEALSPTDR
jgi:hypothetical protein